MKIIRKLNFFRLTKSNLGIMDLSVAFFRNEGRPVIIHLLRQMYLTGGKPTTSGIAAIREFLKYINLLKAHQGIKGVVKYLKTCNVLLQQVIAGHIIPDTGSLGPRVQRNHSGIPSIIPIHYRFAILNGDRMVIRLWMTLFSIYRNIDYEGEVKFSTIVDPSIGSNIDITHIPRFVRLFVGKTTKIKPSQPFPILTSSPNVNDEVEVSSSIWSVIRSVWSLSSANPHLERSLFYIWRYTHSDAIMTLYHEVKEWLSTDKVIIPWASRKWGPSARIKIGKSIIGLIPFLGKLSIKEEPAGKMRVFAMVDCITQWTLKGLHDFLFRILSKHETDGTFNQMRPLRRVPFGEAPVYSLDLTAATDRLPIWLQEDILTEIFGKDFSWAWRNLLCNRDYYISHIQKDYPYLSKYGSSIKYSVGQPMGALSSWAMLALTHHFIVNMSAWSCGFPKDQLFKEYAILGDDIIIWNAQVADYYQSLMKTLGVELGLAKSVISPGGLGLEFAKRTLFKGMDVSPFPLKEAKAGHASVPAILEIQRKYNISDLNIIRWLGYGYKVTPNKNSNLSMRIFALSKNIPRYHYDLIRIFLINSPFLKFDYFKQDVLFGKFVSFLVKELLRLKQSVIIERDNMIHWNINSMMDAGLPLFPRDHSVKVKHLCVSYTDGKRVQSESKIFRFSGSDATFSRRIEGAIVEKELDRILIILSDSVSRLSFALANIKDVNAHIVSPFYPLPPYGFFHGVPHNRVKESTYILFDILELVSSLSAKNITHPARTISENNPIFDGIESANTLRRWNRWFRVFLKVSLITDDKVSSLYDNL